MGRTQRLDVEQGKICERSFFKKTTMSIKAVQKNKSSHETPRKKVNRRIPRHTDH